MKKKTSYILALLLSLCLSANAQMLTVSKVNKSTENATQQAQGFGYANRYADDLYGIGTGKVAILSAYSKVENIKGATLKFVDAVLAACYPDDNGAVIVLDKDKRVVYMEKKRINMRLNHLELKEPYTFETNDPYYIGYLITSTQKATNPLGFDKQESILEGSYIGIHKTMPAKGAELDKEMMNTFEKGHEFGTLMIFAGIENTSVLDNMGYLLELDGVFNATANQNVSAIARIRNIGMKQITSEEIIAKVDAGVQTINKELVIEPGQTVNIPVEIAMPASGTGKVAITLTKINGMANVFAGIERAKKYEILSAGNPFPRETVLIEHFTTEKCKNCPAAEPTFASYIKAFTDAGLKVSIIEHHTGFQTDAFTIKESEEISNYLGVEFAPAAAINRLQLGDNKECAFFPRISYTDNFRKMLKDSLEYGRIKKIEQITENGKVSLKVTGELANGFTENLYLTAVVTEDNLPAISQAGAKRDFIHHDVARLFLSAVNGNKATINGNKFEITFPEKEYKASWKQENMKIVVFGHRVLDATTMKDYKQHLVLFAATQAWNVTNGISEVTTDEMPTIMVKNGYMSIAGAFDSFKVYGMDGKLVATSVNQQLQPGIYTVKVNVGNKKHTAKVVVK